VNSIQTAQPLQNLYARVAERGVYSLETYLIRSGGVTEKDTVKVTNPSSGTLWALVIQPQREIDVSHSLIVGR
jgi:hypothetical protein